MENASKALIMAATILLGLLLVTVFVNVFKAGASVNENYDQSQRTAQLELYNAKFEDFNVKENTIMDVITVANHAYSINAADEYNPSTAIEIILKIGSEVYTIPNENPNPAFNTSQYQTMKNNGTLFEKNKIMHKGKAIPIYDLVNKNAKDLGVQADPKAISEKLTRTYYGPVTYTRYYTAYTKDMATGEIDETEVKEEVTVPLTVYKYMFNCTNIDYHKSSGKIKTMTFEYEKIQKNPDGSNSQFYWQYD